VREEDEDDAPSEGYEWSFARQEQELPSEEYRAHMHLLDEIDQEELEASICRRPGITSCGRRPRPSRSWSGTTRRSSS